MYRALTRDIEVQVEPYYLEEQSDPDDSRYVWGYRIVISNHSAKAVRLTHRYWHITDQNGQVDEVSGPGVVGEQPRLDPGDTYEYSSGCPLDTPSGMMYGTYRMETDDGESFDVEIPAFSLDSPGMVRTLN
ncbi:Co2+/Mg2+ efflux protein ApaG [Rhizobium sp. AQ_MP]|uniref:Co2+/Mg2+ efflux protein ApaG n=1 Tax=Rhizobium sp. AQ_MP TaxID=2761536 RepID=UPI00163AD7FA|nr:Co2+/Mg2+ efflux protein ApaG [Rhizobium sp. AQ_MP]MBC2771584.1 Co2+/Mg2+ efflux protein ApaG [Rhizobium sp. AQ_MP]